MAHEENVDMCAVACSLRERTWIGMVSVLDVEGCSGSVLRV